MRQSRRSRAPSTRPACPGKRAAHQATAAAHQPGAGPTELNFLKRLPPDQARQSLMNIPGVGPKTASIVLLFSFQQPLFPVDTHIFRVTRRLGWIPQNATVEQAHDLLAAPVPPRLYYRLHLNLIQHGRAICHARVPRCEMCRLSDVCAYFQKNGK